MKKCNSVLLIIMGLLAFPMSHIVNANSAMSAGQETSMEQNAGVETGHMLAAVKPVARVNNREILMGDLLNTMQEISESGYGGKEITPAEAELIKKAALDRLILRQVLVQHAESLNIQVTDAEVESRIAQTRSKLGDDKHFSMYLEKKHMTLDQLKDETRELMTVEKAVIQDVDNKIEINDKELEEAYEAAKDEFTEPEVLEVNQVIFFLDPDDKVSITKATGVLESIKRNNNDFNSLESDGTFVVRTGTKLNNFATPGLYEEAKKLKSYELSDIITTDGTIYILQLIGYKPEKITPRETALKTIEKRMKADKRQTLMEDWISGLRKKADIEYYSTIAD